MKVVDFFTLLRDAGRAARTALETAAGPVSYAMLDRRVAAYADRLAALKTRTVASLMDNGADWIVHDLACLRAGLAHLPLPLFFTPDQLRAALDGAGAGALVANTSMAGAPPVLGLDGGEPLSDTLAAYRRVTPEVDLHPGTAKITFTSGSTGNPKGVCLGAGEMLAVAAGLAAATGPLGIQRHFTALPLPVLLENVAGVYAPLMQGAAIAVRPSKQAGLQGSSAFDAAVFHAALEASGAQSVIVLPQMLRAYAGWLRANEARAPAALRFMAVGGAAVGAELLAQARAVGLPAYEGYGLSEACSVQTLNLPGMDRPGSAGRPLPHARLRVAADGEIEVGGALALGYIGQPPIEGAWLPTGDLGYLDAAGFLHIQGRKKNVLITGFGRNVSPEWVELHLTSQRWIAHAVVLGEGKAALGAVVWPLPGATDEAIQDGIERANRALPDYARIGAWTQARAEFSAAAGMATANGRPRRDAIAARHADLFLSTHFPPLPWRTMPFFQELLDHTRASRETLVATPIIQDCLRGQVALPAYIAFLREAYHHVRHTVPLMHACHARMPDRLAWMRGALDEYVEEERGHDEWILNDLRALGQDAEAVRRAGPGPDTEIMVAYAYDTIMRNNPVGFFGMVHVLEGTSVALALNAADRIQAALGLPAAAFSYLRSHGTLDREHTRHFAELMDRLDDPGDQAAVLHAAHMFYKLYGAIFRALPRAQAGDASL